MMTRSRRWQTWFTAAALLLWTHAAAPRAAQAPSLSARDRTEIQQLSEQYLRLLNACAAEEYAALFAPGAFFFSTVRGRIEGRDRLLELVRSERHCAAGAAPRQGSVAPRVQIEPTADGARGFAPLGENVGAYEDRYVRTPQGWRFASRTVLTPSELTARGDAPK
jgi:hypothetical protein